MEIRNFAQAGQVLSEIWSQMVIDGHLTVAEYISPTDTSPGEKVQWISREDAGLDIKDRWIRFPYPYYDARPAEYRNDPEYIIFAV